MAHGDGEVASLVHGVRTAVESVKALANEVAQLDREAVSGVRHPAAASLRCVGLFVE
jgi:hypothetical protein